jgi:hypothetical protein
MAHVVSLLAPVLKATGFKKQRHTFNRSMEPGLVHVLNFQMGRFPIGTHETPTPRSTLYGKFTLNLGVFVGEVFEAMQDRAVPSFAREHDCEFRVRLGQLSQRPSNAWWSLSDDPEDLVAGLTSDIRDFAEPWFARYETRDAILSVSIPGDADPGWPGRAPIVLAIMRLHRGEKPKAQLLLRDYLAEAMRNPRQSRHCDWVLGLAGRLGFDKGSLA